MKKKIIIVVGTRPEVIKMAPVRQALKDCGQFTVLTVNSGQHEELIDNAFEVFDWKPDFSLKISRKNKTLLTLYIQLMSNLDALFKSQKPDLVVVHGDTATTAAASMSSALSKIKLAHVEAGLRSHSKWEPWPEELNRKLTDIFADIYFAPTNSAEQNLLNEGVAKKTILVTGNTVVDALLHVQRKIENDRQLVRDLEEKYRRVDPNKKTILLTGHRRENFGSNFRQVLIALDEISKKIRCQIIFPAHPNGELKGEISKATSSSTEINIIDSVNYLEFVFLMQRCDLIITDSGGIQEEAPSLKKKVLVTRNVTERSEGISPGYLEIIGCDAKTIADRAVSILLSSEQTFTGKNPYGDGQASKRICQFIMEYFSEDNLR